MQQMLGMRVEYMLSGCLSLWLHIAAVSQHFGHGTIPISQLNQTHQNIGIECQKEHSSFAVGWFLNSVYKDAYYFTFARKYDIFFGHALLGITAMDYDGLYGPTFAALPQVGLTKEWGGVGVNLLYVPGIPNTIQPYQILFLQFKVEI